jgi:hypothetical protein
MPASHKPVEVERLTAAAIFRDGSILHRGFRSHYELRSALGDEHPQYPMPGDIEGFITSSGRFVGRLEAKSVGIASGQLSEQWNRVQRPVLSSDIRWEFSKSNVAQS